MLTYREKSHFGNLKSFSTQNYFFFRKPIYSSRNVNTIFFVHQQFFFLVTFHTQTHISDAMCYISLDFYFVPFVFLSLFLSAVFYESNSKYHRQMFIENYYVFTGISHSCNLYIPKRKKINNNYKMKRKTMRRLHFEQENIKVDDSIF